MSEKKKPSYMNKDLDLSGFVIQKDGTLGTSKDNATANRKRQQ